MKYNLSIIIGILLVCAGFYKEDDIHVAEGLEVSYTLPQGDHAYDTTIMNWYEKYGFYTLYIFEDKDIYWANTNWDERVEGWSGGGNLQGHPADPDYVGELLNVIEQGFIDVYPDSLVAHYMPLKLLLCSDLWDVLSASTYDWTTGEYIELLDSTKLWARKGWDYIAVNGGSEAMRPTTVEDKLDLQAEINTIFLQRLYGNGVLEIPEEFETVSDYSTYGYYMATTVPNIFELGFVMDNPLGSFNSGLETMVSVDFEAYLPLLARSLAWLESEPGNALYIYNIQYYATLVLKGVLHPKRDVNGLIRQKYEILMNMLAEKGIDVQQLQYPEFD